VPQIRYRYYNFFIMPKKLRFTIVAAVSSLAALLSFYEQVVELKGGHQAKNSFNSDGQKSENNLTTLIEGSGQPLTNRKAALAVSMTASSKLMANPIAARMDYLLVTDKLTDFSEAELTKIATVCQNKQHSASDTACSVYQHWNELVANEDGINGQLESVWVEAEKNSGVEFQDNVEITPLAAAQITQESGGLTESLDSVLQNLQDRALYDPSTDVRYKAIQDAISLKDPTLIPMLEKASNDENQENAELATDGLIQIQKVNNSSFETSDNHSEQIKLSGVQHISDADMSSR
jgi:hypothetical protein